MRATLAGANAAGPVLQGLRIIEFPAFIAAPLGGLTLAQLGADVIRVDPLGGNIDDCDLLGGRSS